MIQVGEVHWTRITDKPGETETKPYFELYRWQHLRYLDSGSFIIPPLTIRELLELGEKHNLLFSIVLGGVEEAAVEAVPQFCSCKQHLWSSIRLLWNRLRRSKNPSSPMVSALIFWNIERKSKYSSFILRPSVEQYLDTRKAKVSKDENEKLTFSL